MKAIQFLSSVLMSGYMVVWILIGGLWWDDISAWLNTGISVDVVSYSTLTFRILIIPYIFFTIGSGLKSFYLGTGKPAMIFLSSLIVNILIYMPLGYVVQHEDVILSFQTFLWITFGVFSLDIVLMILFLKINGYNRLMAINR